MMMIGASCGMMLWRTNGAVLSERGNCIVINHFADKPSKESVRPKTFQATYTVERKFEVRKFALSNSEYSYQQVADAFNMPKMTMYDIINRGPGGEPAKSRGNKKGAGRQLSYSQETEDQLVQWVLEMRDLHLPVSIMQVKEKADSASSAFIQS